MVCCLFFVSRSTEVGKSWYIKWKQLMNSFLYHVEYNETCTYARHGIHLEPFMSVWLKKVSHYSFHIQVNRVKCKLKSKCMTLLVYRIYVCDALFRLINVNTCSWEEMWLSQLISLLSWTVIYLSLFHPIWRNSYEKSVQFS